MFERRARATAEHRERERLSHRSSFLIGRLRRWNRVFRTRTSTAPEGTDHQETTIGYRRSRRFRERWTSMTSVDLAVFSTGWLLGWLLLWRTRPLSSSVRPAREPLAVIVPARNEARSIGTLVDRIVPQLQPGDEFLVVDDESDDGTAELARSARRPGHFDLADARVARQATCLLAGSRRHHGADTAVRRRRRAPVDTTPRRHRGRRPVAPRRRRVGAALASHRPLVRAGQHPGQRGGADGFGCVHGARRACPSDGGLRAGRSRCGATATTRSGGTKPCGAGTRRTSVWPDWRAAPCCSPAGPTRRSGCTPTGGVSSSTVGRAPSRPGCDRPGGGSRSVSVWWIATLAGGWLAGGLPRHDPWQAGLVYLLSRSSAGCSDDEPDHSTR